MVTAITSHVFCTYTRIMVCNFWLVICKKKFKICVFQTSSFSENDPNSEIVLLPTTKHRTNPIVHHRRCLPNTRACARHVSTRLRKRTIVWNSAGYPTTSTADTKLCRSPDNKDAEVRTHHASVAPASLVTDSSTDSI